MPDKSEKDRLKLVSQPSQSLLQRLLGMSSPDGGPLSTNTRNDWPELEKQVAGRQIEMPNESAAVKSIRPMNMVERAITPGADAITWPWGTVALNRNNIEKDGSNLGDVLVHELTHVGQNANGGVLGGLMRNISEYSKPYMQKPTEKEAFNKEWNRPVRRFDINLPSPDVKNLSNKVNTNATK